MKVLVFYASAGDGHRRAAEAIGEAFVRLGHGDHVVVADALDYTNALFRWVYPRFYILLIRRASWLWGFGYWLFDQDPCYRLFRWFRRWFNRAQSRRLVMFIEAVDPAVIVGTHFMPMEVAGDLARQGRTTRRITVLTDFRPHAFWMTGTDQEWMVASEASASAVARRGVPPDHVHVTGIPISLSFDEHRSRPETAQRLGIDSDRFTVLVTTGGFGVGRVAALVEELIKNTDLQVVVVCGRNHQLQDRLARSSAASNSRVTLLGYVDNMAEWMTVADVVVAKPGGLTTSETLAVGRPMVLVDPIPGQETRNADLLEVLGAAVQGQDPVSAAGIVNSLAHSPGRLRSLQEQAAQLGHPRAATQIAEKILKYVNDRST